MSALKTDLKSSSGALASDMSVKVQFSIKGNAAAPTTTAAVSQQQQQQVLRGMAQRQSHCSYYNRSSSVCRAKARAAAVTESQRELCGRIRTLKTGLALGFRRIDRYNLYSGNT